MLERRQIIGLGTGRCGTESLSSLLTQDDCFVSHEQYQMDWHHNHHNLQNNLNLFRQRPESVVGDVAFWWLNYVPLVKAKFVCLKRDKSKTVRSFLKWFRNKDYWTSQANETDKVQKNDNYTVVFRSINTSFPKFPTLNVEHAINLYYDLYYTVASRFEKQLNNFRIFDMDYVLNTEDGQRDLFDWLDLPNHQAKEVHLNGCS
jgi:hypothetical protein